MSPRWTSEPTGFGRCALKTTGLWPSDHNPASRRSLNWTVKRDVYPAEATGFEPAVSALTGLHVRPLHHASERDRIVARPRDRCQDAAGRA